jgi:hypothetical protein
LSAANALPSEFRGLPALSIRQPWVWCILHASKRIENRSWPTRVRGRILIHAAKGCTRDEWLDAKYFISGFSKNSDKLPPIEDLDRGGIVGVAELIDCVQESDSKWFVGRYGFVLRNVQSIPLIPCKGERGFFQPKFVEAA